MNFSKHIFLTNSLYGSTFTTLTVFISQSCKNKERCANTRFEYVEMHNNPLDPHLIGIIKRWVFDLNLLNLEVCLNTPVTVCIRIYRQSPPQKYSSVEGRFLRREAVIKIFLPPFGCDLVRPPYVVIDSNLFSMTLSFLLSGNIIEYICFWRFNSIIMTRNKWLVFTKSVIIGLNKYHPDLARLALFVYRA